MIIARPRSSWRCPKGTTVSSRDGMASTRSGRRKIGPQCCGDRRESRDETPGLEQGREYEREPRKDRAQSLEIQHQCRRHGGEQPRNSFLGFRSTGDMRSPESRRDGGGCMGWMFRRPYGTRLVEIVPWKPGLRKAPSWAIARRPYGTRGPGSPSKTVRAPPPVRLLCSHRCGGYDLGVGSSCSVRCGLIEVCDEDTPAAKRRCHCGQGAER